MIDSGCGKINFSSKAETVKYIKSARLSSSRRGGKFSGKVTPYECRFCSEWHMTSRNKKQSNSAKRKHKERCKQ